MRPVKRKAFAPLLPARANEPLTVTVRVHAFALRLRLVGLTHRMPLCRPLDFRATVNRTAASRSRLKLTRAPVAVRAASALGPLRAARKRPGESVKADSLGAVAPGPGPPRGAGDTA